MNICILGYSGKIGSNLLNKLKVNKNNLIFVSREKKEEINKYRYIYCDLNSISEELIKVLKDCDILINIIGEYRDESKMLQTNFELVQNLLDQINNNQREKKIHFIQLSSCSVYGYNYEERLLNENSKTLPTNYYGKTKLDAENIIKKNINNFFTYTIIRPSGVIDNLDRKSSLFKFLEIATRKFVVLFGKKDSIGNFIHVEDLTQLIIEVSFNKKAENKIFNISDNFYYFKVLEDIDKKLSIKPMRIYFYSNLFLILYSGLRRIILNFLKIPDIRFLAYRTKYDSSLIRTELNFKFSENIQKIFVKHLLDKKIINPGEEFNNNS